ncbi:SGNH/GDSL hydrolase family protein [Pseudoalteromonas sp. OOF1S-7]|uniref:SGNH/GDSL hydrolase family protein n=1 Tax=Pseudoalteromonas sp. OOF1S-7 TaxID=2917757 RepID=UPI001EF7070A|nr:SGNH/GDSL hydrolase family protein [Pseudoalteromonas sp. OOF1S-7]MCG7534196.1 GDSL-type esterase/lipase family protein [Pseudoalteromonas sp. OOF1S-7]
MCRLILILLGLTISLSGFATVLPATHHALIYEGRVHKNYQQGSVEFNWPGTTIHTQLVGKSIAIRLQGYGDQFDVLVDGQLHRKIETATTGETERFVLFEQAHAGRVLIEVVKRWEHYQSRSKLLHVEVDGRLEGVWETQPHILFIGDSISAGFGSESTKRQCDWQEIVDSSNARLAFPYVAAQQLNSTFTQVSYSGLGLIRNWNGNQAHHTLVDYVDQLSAVYGDNLSYQERFPNLIVLEFGTNDFSTDPQPHEPWQNIEEVKLAWEEAMVDFVHALRSRYPGVAIVVMPRPAYPYDFIIPATETALRQLASEGIEQVYANTFVSPLEGCIWHPTAREHQHIASELVEFIKQHNLL